jgi:hypothetical protein
MRIAQFILFTAGYLSICYGCYLKDPALGYIAAGTIVCGLMVWNRVRTAEHRPGDDTHA